MWQQWINVILGLWVILIPFLNMTSDGLVWSLVITGVVVSALGLWGAAEASSKKGSHTMAHRA